MKWRRHRALAFLFPLLTITMSCIGSNTKDIHWREEVVVAPGTLIVVERGERLVLAGEPGAGQGWLFESAWLKATLPKIGATEWSGFATPLVLNTENGVDWYLLCAIGSHRGEEEYRLEAPFVYVVFRLSGGAWHRIPFGEFPKALRPNLLGDPQDHFIRRGHKNGSLVDLTTKRRAEDDPSLSPTYKSIDRTRGR